MKPYDIIDGQKIDAYTGEGYSPDNTEKEPQERIFVRSTDYHYWSSPLSAWKVYCPACGAIAVMDDHCTQCGQPFKEGNDPRENDIYVDVETEEGTYKVAQEGEKHTILIKGPRVEVIYYKGPMMTKEELKKWGKEYLCKERKN